jgi:type I restriction enzyme S subunit
MSFPRYESYKDSGVEWLGDVPKHWQTVQFKRLASIQNGRDYKHIETDGDDGYPVIGSGGEFAKATECLFTGESVLLGRKGTINKPLYINGSFWVVDTMFYTVVNKKAMPKYLYYCALTIRFDLYSTSTALPSMTQNDLGSILFTLPDVTEQQNIATFLDRETAKIDALIAEQQRLIELLKEKRQAVISHAVTKGLNSDAPMKDSGIEWLGEVPEHWEVRCAKSVSTFITSGPRGWSERVGYDGHLFIQSGDLNDLLQVEFATAKRVQVGDDAETSRTRLSDGDVVVCITGAKTGNVAVCVTVPEKAYVNQHLCLIRPSQEVLPVYLGVLLKSKIGQTYFELSQYGLKQGLSLENIKEAPVLLPPHAEQTTIVDFLDRETTKLDTLTAEAQRGIELLKERRTALISAAVTGKIDVRGLVSVSTPTEAAA